MPAVAGLTLLGIVARRVAAAWPASFRRGAEAAGCVSEQAHSGGRARRPQLVLHRHAHSAARAARGDVRNLFVLPRGRRHRRRSGPARAAARATGDSWRADIDALYRGAPPPQLAGLGAGGARHSICSARISSPSSTAWRWMSSPTSARRTGRRSISIATASPARSAGCRCACSAWSTSRPRARPSSRPRAAAHQYPARPRRGRRRSAGSICRARRCARPASRRPIRPRCSPIRRSASLRAHRRAGGSGIRAADAIMAKSPRRVVRAPRIMGEAYRLILDSADRARLCAAARARSACRAPSSSSSCCAISCDAMSANGPHHRRRPRRPVRRGPACGARPTASWCTRRPRSPAAAAAPITTPRSA